MIQRRRDQVEPGPRPCSSFMALIGHDRSSKSLLQGHVDVQNGLFTWSTSSSADRRRCIKSECKDFPRTSLGSSSANHRKQKKPPASSGCRSSLFHFLELQIRIWTSRNHQTGCARLGNTPLRRAPLAESGRRPRAYEPTLRDGLPGQHRPSTGVFFLQITGKPARGYQKPPLGSRRQFFGIRPRSREAVYGAAGSARPRGNSGDPNATTIQLGRRSPSYWSVTQASDRLEAGDAMTSDLRDRLGRIEGYLDLLREFFGGGGRGTAA